MSDSSIVIIQGTVGLYTVATRCHTCFAVTLKYTEDSSLTILRHSLLVAYSEVDPGFPRQGSSTPEFGKKTCYLARFLLK